MTESQVSEAQIAVHWREEEYIYPPESFVAQATRPIRPSSTGLRKTVSRIASPNTRTC